MVTPIGPSAGIDPYRDRINAYTKQTDVQATADRRGHDPNPAWLERDIVDLEEHPDRSLVVVRGVPAPSPVAPFIGKFVSGVAVGAGFGLVVLFLRGLFS